MSERAPYSRVYWTIRSDDRLAAVYADDRHLATWLRLLMAADMAWPAPADMPSSVRKSSVQALVDAGVVSLCGGGMFTFHGLDAERGRRRLAATRNRLGQDPDGPAGGPSPSPVAPQPGPRRDPDGLSTPGRSRDEPRRAETSRDDARDSGDRRADLDAFLAVRFRPPTPAQRTLLDAYCHTFDVTGPERAARLILSHPDDPIGAVKADLLAFREERRKAAADSEAPKPVRRKGSGLTGVNAELAAILHGRYAAEAEPAS